MSYLDIYRELSTLETGMKDGKPPSTVRAIYPYSATEGDELSFLMGDQILVLEKFDDGWWLGTFCFLFLGQCNENQGVFPSNYVT